MKYKRSVSKKGLTGLQRVGVFPDLEWLYMGQKFGTLKQVVGFNNHRLAKLEAVEQAEKEKAREKARKKNKKQ